VREERVVMRIFGPKRGEVIEIWRKSHMRSLVICILHLILFG
jgi:DNA-directed RNA polymerase subunit H (RpoH/RPB5)